MPDLSVSVSTRNRKHDLLRCIRSLQTLSPLKLDVVVVDNGSTEPVDSYLPAAAAADLPDAELRVLRFEDPLSPNAARNLIAREARADIVFSVDDDAYLLHGTSVHEGLQILRSDPSVGIIALTQTGPDGSAQIGPDGHAPLPYACWVSGYAAYGALLRRGPFVELGGYTEMGWATFEEPDFARRLLDTGQGAVWLPTADLVHVPSPIGRDEIRRMRFNARNACYSAIRNEPLPLLGLTLVARVWTYRRASRYVARRFNLTDSGGLRWVAKEVLANWSTMWSMRRPLRWSTYWRWSKTKKTHPAYRAPHSG